MVFLALANQLGIASFYVETFLNESLGTARAGLQGHVFTKIYDTQHHQWQIYEPINGFQSGYVLDDQHYTPVAIGRDHSAAYLLNVTGEPSTAPQRIDSEDALRAVAAKAHVPHQNLHDISVVKDALIHAGKEDQDIRKTNHYAAGNATDIKNQDLLKQIIDLHGWPTISLVGKKAEQSAFLITQHAMNDLPFMERVFTLRTTLPEGETSSASTALMEDRILMMKDSPQKYGSQLKGSRGASLCIHPIEGIDIEKLLNGDRLQMTLLEARRKNVGLNQPYRDYLAHFEIKIEEPKGRIL